MVQWGYCAFGVVDPTSIWLKQTNFWTVCHTLGCSNSKDGNRKRTSWISGLADILCAGVLCISHYRVFNFSQYRGLSFWLYLSAYCQQIPWWCNQDMSRIDSGKMISIYLQTAGFSTVLYLYKQDGFRFAFGSHLISGEGYGVHSCMQCLTASEGHSSGELKLAECHHIQKFQHRW